MPRQTNAPADRQPAPGGAAAVDRALSLLGAFKAGDVALSLAELAQRTGLYKSTALRLIASLEHAGLLQRLETGGYALGSEVARLSALYSAAFSLDRVVPQVLHELVALTGESAAYHVLRGQGKERVRLCQYRVDSPHPVRDHIRAGDVLPADRGTGGRVLMAFESQQGTSISAKDQALYAQIRQQGWHAGVGDRLAEVAGISAPVFHADGRIAAALTLSMPAHRYQESLVQQVLQAAKRLNGRV
jgi:DNA-binding IclR family transcriptional regulator